MRRRDLIAFVGGAVAWPLAAQAQQPTTPVIGVLWPGQTPPGSPRMESFTQALRQLGFIEGQNVSIELRYARGGLQQLPELAAELVRIKVDVLATFGDLTPKIAQQAMRRSRSWRSATTSLERELSPRSRDQGRTQPD
jgi:putative tryptophan/tyrosine transport system substrate-binding protein